MARTWHGAAVFRPHGRRRISKVLGTQQRSRAPSAFDSAPTNVRTPQARGRKYSLSSVIPHDATRGAALEAESNCPEAACAEAAKSAASRRNAVRGRHPCTTSSRKGTMKRCRPKPRRSAVTRARSEGATNQRWPPWSRVRPLTRWRAWAEQRLPLTPRKSAAASWVQQRLPPSPRLARAL